MSISHWFRLAGTLYSKKTFKKLNCDKIFSRKIKKEFNVHGILQGPKQRMENMHEKRIKSVKVFYGVSNTFVTPPRARDLYKLFPDWQSPQ